MKLIEIHKEVEKRTKLFITECQANSAFTAPKYISYKGIEVYVRYPKGYGYFRSSSFGNDLTDYLVIASVCNRKNKNRGKGWFWGYVDFCRSLVTGGVVIECVRSRKFYESLKGKTEFFEYSESNFYIPSK